MYSSIGEMDRLRMFWLSGACTKSGSGKGRESSHQLDIINFTSAYILLIVGIGLSILLLFAEHVYFNFWRRKLRKVDRCGCCALISLVSYGTAYTHTSSHPWHNDCRRVTGIYSQSAYIQIIKHRADDQKITTCSHVAGGESELFSFETQCSRINWMTIMQMETKIYLIIQRTIIALYVIRHSGQGETLRSWITQDAVLG